MMQPVSTAWLSGIVQRVLLSMRSGALAVVITAAAVTSSWFGARIFDANQQNAKIAAMANGDDVAVDAGSADGALLIARHHFLIERDRIDDAQVLIDTAGKAVPDSMRSRLLYNHGNARVRQAIAHIERGALDKAIPLVRLAKDSYRQALRLDPAAWDTKHNFDVAMRLVRDLPTGEQEGEEVPPDAPKKLWTDLPGTPKGLP